MSLVLDGFHRHANRKPCLANRHQFGGLHNRAFVKIELDPDTQICKCRDLRHGPSEFHFLHTAPNLLYPPHQHIELAVHSLRGLLNVLRALVDNLGASVDSA